MSKAFVSAKTALDNFIMIIEKVPETVVLMNSWFNTLLHFAIILLIFL